MAPLARPLIRELHEVPPQLRDVPWLKQNLQWAVQLELSTIPPYLCALWSIAEQSGEVYDLILSVVMEEMLHMSLACNLLTTIGGTPELDATTTPTYPRGLPGGVHPGLQVSLAALSQDVVLNTFMQIELPESQPSRSAGNGNTYPTIGDFYDAVSAAFQALPTSAFVGVNQLSADIHGEQLYPIYSVGDAVAAIEDIKDQGEGTSKSPLDLEGQLGHYFRFGEVAYGRKLIQTNSGWEYVGDPVPWPSVLPMATVPAGGYTQSAAFDHQYTNVLTTLQAAWATGSQAALFEAVSAMMGLAGPARQLMQTPIPGGSGNYGPSFLYLPSQ